ncbi:hypothetical protein [Empedobacter sp.]|uniref:hypothetical protein n=1 Tax=Empedobacter sp. TaxID=1927715 RepID=UPI0028AFBF3B|nr:hypothetical protein [Empedobacter sp.]
MTARKKKDVKRRTLSVKLITQKDKTPFPKTKLARCTGKGVDFKTNVELKN